MASRWPPLHFLWKGVRTAESGRQKAEGGERQSVLPSAFRLLPSPLSTYF
jgi:hypothetical protein